MHGVSIFYIQSLHVLCFVVSSHVKILLATMNYSNIGILFIPIGLFPTNWTSVCLTVSDCFYFGLLITII